MNQFITYLDGAHVDLPAGVVRARGVNHPPVRAGSARAARRPGPCSVAAAELSAFAGRIGRITVHGRRRPSSPPPQAPPRFAYQFGDHRFASAGRGVHLGGQLLPVCRGGQHGRGPWARVHSAGIYLGWQRPEIHFSSSRLLVPCVADGECRWTARKSRDCIQYSDASNGPNGSVRTHMKLIFLPGAYQRPQHAYR